MAMVLRRCSYPIGSVLLPSIAMMTMISATTPMIATKTSGAGIGHAEAIRLMP